jgi:parallel beta-helix repeat protein
MVAVTAKLRLALLGAALIVSLAAWGQVTVHGYVREDFYPLGADSGEDQGISHVRVALFWDANGNGVLDYKDELCAEGVTGPDGSFSLDTAGCKGDSVFVAVDSRTIVSTRGLNSGYSEDQIWAEETYQSDYDSGSHTWPLHKMFGGRDPDVSDDFDGKVYEHWIPVDLKLYPTFEADLVFGFSFEVIVNTRDVDEDGTSGTGRSAQGTLRQFLENARAIRGPDHSYFVFPPGAGREIVVDPNLYMDFGGPYNRAAHPGYGVDSETVLDGRILDWDLDPTGDVILVSAIKYPDDCLLFLATGDTPTMENLEIRGNTSAVPKTGIRGIRLSGATYGTFQDIEVYECHIGLELYWNAQYNEITRVEAHHNSHSGIYFYWVTGAHNIYNTVSNCTSHDNAYTGIGLWNDSDNNTISDNEVYDNGWAGIWIGYVCDDNTVQGNYAHDNAVAGILVSAWPGYEPRGNVVSENVVESNGGFWGTLPEWGTTVRYDAGIGLYGAANTVVKDNIVKDNQHPDGPVYGIAIENGKDNEISGNEIYGNGIGIVVLDDASYGNVISRNSIYRNAGLGIDLGADGVTPNDGALGSPNRGVDYPVFTQVTLTPSGGLEVAGFINTEGAGAGSPNFAGAIVEVFLVRSGSEGDDLIGNEHDGRYYGEGWRYLGSLVADSGGNFSGTLSVDPSWFASDSLVTGTATLTGAGTSEFGVTRAPCDPHDLNGDCAVDITDGRIIYKIAMGCLAPTDEQRQAGDIDGDGDIDMDDVAWYVERILGGGE